MVGIASKKAPRVMPPDARSTVDLMSSVILLVLGAQDIQGKEVYQLVGFGDI